MPLKRPLSRKKTFCLIKNQIITTLKMATPKVKNMVMVVNREEVSQEATTKSRTVDLNMNLPEEAKPTLQAIDHAAEVLVEDQENFREEMKKSQKLSRMETSIPIMHIQVHQEIGEE